MLTELILPHEHFHHASLISDREDIWRLISYHMDLLWSHHYCCYIKKRDEILNNIITSKYVHSAYHQYVYCCYIEDNERVWKALVKNTVPDSAEWQHKYYRYVRYRSEMFKAANGGYRNDN